MTPHKCPVCDGKGIRPDDSEDCFACDATGIVWADKGEPQKVVHEHHYYHHGPYYAQPWTYTTGDVQLGSSTTSIDLTAGTDGTSTDTIWTNVPYAVT